MGTIHGDGLTSCPDRGDDLSRRVALLERQLAAVEQHFQSFIEDSSETIMLLDISGVVCYTSPVLERTLGYAPADYLGMSLFPLIHPEDQPQIAPLFQALAMVPGASASARLRLRHRLGHWCWIEAMAKNQLDLPQIAGIVVNLHNVESIYPIEPDPRAEHDLLKSVMRTSVTAIVVVNPEGRLVFVNQRAEQILGAPRDELLRRSYDAVEWQISDAYGEDYPAAAMPFRQVMDRGDPVTGAQHAIMLPNGERRVLSVNGAPIRSGAGQIINVVFSITDITEQQAFEEQLRRRQQMEAIGRLAGGVAHDFNNALTVILGACSFLLDEASPAMRHDLEQIQQAGERVSKLTRQLLALSRQQLLMPQPIQINTNVERMRLMLQRMLGRQNDLLLHLDPALALIHADAHQIDLVLVNLVSHALDSMPQGGTVLIETAEVVLDAGCLPAQTIVPGRYAMLAVSDTGEGMDAITRERIFDPFFAGRWPGSSTGLALSSAQGTVLQSGGAIWVGSDLGYGSTFKVFLPFAMAEQAAPQPAPPPIPAPRTVLLIEPDPQTASFATGALSQAGYQVICAATLEQAYTRSMAADAVDVLIVDVLALDLAPWLGRLRARWPLVQALYTSSHTRMAIAKLAPALATPPDLFKPFAAATLLSRVRALCFDDVGAA